MRAHEQAPPDPGFRDRLRALADAAAEMRNAHARALQAGLARRPKADSERARPPYELRPGTGNNLGDLADAYAAVAQAASELADAAASCGRVTRNATRPAASAPSASRGRSISAL
jgi:hypothetical protein